VSAEIVRCKGSETHSSSRHGKCCEHDSGSVICAELSEVLITISRERQLGLTFHLRNIGGSDLPVVGGGVRRLGFGVGCVHVLVVRELEVEVEVELIRVRP